jgi:hypothetical protein
MHLQRIIINASELNSNSQKSSSVANFLSTVSKIPATDPYVRTDVLFPLMSLVIPHKMISDRKSHY